MQTRNLRYVCAELWTVDLLPISYGHHGMIVCKHLGDMLNCIQDSNIEFQSDSTGIAVNCCTKNNV